MRGVTDVGALLEEEVLVGVMKVLIDGHQVQCIAGVGLVLTMAELLAQAMIGTMVRHMTGIGVLNMVDIAGIYLKSKCYISWASLWCNSFDLCKSLYTLLSLNVYILLCLLTVDHQFRG